jgi:hypothetical protein
VGQEGEAEQKAKGRRGSRKRNRQRKGRIRTEEAHNQKRGKVTEDRGDGETKVSQGEKGPRGLNTETAE